jgi:hypothetical protein
VPSALTDRRVVAGSAAEVAIIEVVAPDEEAIIEFARDIADRVPRALGVVVPSIPGVGSFAWQILKSLGKSNDLRGRWTPANALLELAAAWLTASDVDHVVLLHGAWLRPSDIGPIIGFLRMTTTTVFLIVHPTHKGSVNSPFGDWHSEVWSWESFREWAAARTDLAVVESEAVAAEVSLAPVGLARPVHTLAATTPKEDAVRAAFYSTRPSIRSINSPWAMARTVRKLLAQIDPEIAPDTLAGLAAALGERGYELRVSQPLSSIAQSGRRELRWSDLRCFIDPRAAAVIALFSLGLGTKDCARLSMADVAQDATSVTTRRRRIKIPAQARPAFRAQRLLRSWSGAGMADPFLTEQTRGLTPHQIKDLLDKSLRTLRFELDARSFDDCIWPSQRWLLAHGLAVHRTRAADEIERADALYGRSPERLCRHGLPNWVAVNGNSLSHSQHLCRSQEPAEVRPLPGYRIDVIETSDGVQRWAVTCLTQPAGQLWSVATPYGVVWLQSMEPILPAIDEVVKAVLRAQLAKHATPGPKARHIA